MNLIDTRDEPNGSLEEIVIVDTNLADLRFGQKIEIIVKNVTRKAVVDVIVANFWGGTRAALAHWRQYRTVHPGAMMKVVWQDDTGDWEESRDVHPASLENFEAWINAFTGDTPPTPMP